jgi:hypothetical protein
MAISNQLRWQVLWRDQFTCRYCGKSAPHVPLVIDHVFPKAHGGKDKLENLTAACEQCNNGKRDQLPPERVTDAVREATAEFLGEPDFETGDLSDALYEAEIHVQCLAELAALPGEEVIDWLSRAYEIAPEGFHVTRDEILRCAGGLAMQERRRQEAGNGAS